MSEAPGSTLWTLAEVLERLKGAIGRTKLVEHLKAVPHFAGGPTHRRICTKYLFTPEDVARIIESLAASPYVHRPETAYENIPQRPKCSNMTGLERNWPVWQQANGVRFPARARVQKQPRGIESMGLRFRRSIRLAKGLRVNLSKSGASLSVGQRGATVNFGPKGEKVTVGLPGTGLSYSKMMTKPPASEGRFVDLANETDRSPPSQNQSGRISAILPWLAVLAVLLVIVAGLIAQSS